MLMRGAVLLALLAHGALFATSIVAQEQPHVYVDDPGPGEPGVILREALEQPYVIVHEQWNTRLFRDSVFDRSVLVLGSDASVASTVHGDVIVVGGDIYLRPGARIDGRAIAYGGGIYDSEQALVSGGKLSYWDTHFDIARTSRGIALDYRPPSTLLETETISLPLLYGIRIPTYTRVDGLGLPWGPRLSLAMGEGGELQVDPTVTYRSDIGAFDPVVSARLKFEPGWSLDVFAGRGTFTNDKWIESDLINSLKVFIDGRDYRNYWRAERIEGRAGRTWTGTSGELTLWGGARTERDWSMSAGGPWSIRGRTAGDGMIRPNPAVERGRLSSAIGGVSGSLSLPDVELSADLQLERPFESPGDERFTQATVDAGVQLATFATQTIELRSHAVLTTGDDAPPQRFSYFGGSGTLPTFSVLQFGGDQLVVIESAYNIPITAVQIPLLGPPVLSLRHALGAAGVGELPSFEQNLIVRVALGVIAAQYAIDPATRNDTFSLALTSPIFW